MTGRETSENRVVAAMAEEDRRTPCAETELTAGEVVASACVFSWSTSVMASLLQEYPAPAILHNTSNCIKVTHLKPFCTLLALSLHSP